MITKHPFPALRLLVSLPLVVVALLPMSGCTQVLVSPETRGEYKLGELQVFVDRNFSAVHSAAKLGIKDAGLFETRDDRLVVEAELNARDATDTLVIVKVKELSPSRTSVKIRYGLKGDLASAQRLYQAIQRRL
jgi:hypothetical protein